MWNLCCIEFLQCHLYTGGGYVSFVDGRGLSIVCTWAGATYRLCTRGCYMPRVLLQLHLARWLSGAENRKMPPDPPPPPGGGGRQFDFFFDNGWLCCALLFFLNRCPIWCSLLFTLRHKCMPEVVMFLATFAARVLHCWQLSHVPHPLDLILGTFNTNSTASKLWRLEVIQVATPGPQ